MFERPKPLVIAVMDGVGVAPPGPGNAISLANTPNLDKLWPNFPHTYLQAAGLNVGLPHGVDGNSEVGHMNLGAGKIIYQELPRIDNAINNKAFFKNKFLTEAVLKSKTNNLHIIGLIGTGQVHASYGHLLALIEMVERVGGNGANVFLHLFTDGRDSEPQGAQKLIERLESELEQSGGGQIASICGRYYAMDRDDRWERTRKAYDMIVYGKGTLVSHWQDALKMSYKDKKYDEFIEPFVVTKGGKPLATVNEDDAVIFFNYRPDRAVQLTRAFEDEHFPGWERPMIKNLLFVGMSNYEKGFPRKQAFPPDLIHAPLGKVLSDNGLRQLRIAESEKFPHVTYFFNGRDQDPYPGEDRIEVPSPREVASYDQKPEMSALTLTNILLSKMQENYYDVIIVNYANADMVSHTGVLDATIKGVEVIDLAIGKIAEFVLRRGGVLLITSDHGNAEEMINLQDGGVDTKHSTNPVPFMYIKKNEPPRELSFGILADFSPTVLSILGISKPVEMTGRNLLM